jgi:hypothetical protein
MAQVIATAEIHRTVKPGKAATDKEPAVPPVVQVIKPGTVFVTTGDEEASLRAARAIRDAEAGEVGAAAPERAAAPVQEQAADTSKTGQRAAKPGKKTDGGEGDGSNTDLV